MISYTEVVIILCLNGKFFYFSAKSANAESTIPIKSQLALLFRLFDSAKSILLK